jgi:hypothetical protein
MSIDPVTPDDGLLLLNPIREGLPNIQRQWADDLVVVQKVLL